MNLEARLQAAAFEIMLAAGSTPNSIAGRIAKARITDFVKTHPKDADDLRQRLLTILAGDL